MIATDPLSLVFLACAVFAGAFLVISSVLGLGQAHGVHFGAHTAVHTHLQVGHSVGAHAVAADTHVAHNGHLAPAHTSAQSAGQHGQASQSGAPATSDAPPGLKDLFLGSLNLYGLLLFLLVFGLIGYLLHNVTNFGAVVSLLFALGVSAVVALIVSAFLARYFLLSGAEAMDSASSRLEGRLGQVSMTIRAGGIGEVIYTGATGSRQSIGARSSDGEAIPRETEVVILAYRDGIASVQSWDHFMASVRAGNAPALNPLDLPI